jgi:hypothetical protein
MLQFELHKLVKLVCSIQAPKKKIEKFVRFDEKYKFALVV